MASSAFDPNLPPETYAFSASVDGNGGVRGQMQIRFSDVALNLHVQITCLAVNGTSAWIGGVVTHTSDENAFPLGGELWFRVQDNGEGSADPPDQMSFIRLGAAASTCSQQRPVGMPFKWLHGNVRVR